MKYILRTLWLIGYMPVFIFACIIFLVMLFAYPLAGAFYFIKTGSWENCPFIPPSLSVYICNKYDELLKLFMTRIEYYNIREKIGIQQQVSTFIKCVMDMREIYPQFKQMTLDEIYEYLNQKETVWEMEIKNDLNIK